MAYPVTLEVVGNRILERYSDGTIRWFKPSAGGVFLPGPHSAAVPTGSGGEVGSTPTTGGTPGTKAAPVDDYPWPAAPQDDLSPLRYSYRDCTDFAAWRINRDLGCVAAPWMYTWGQLRLTNGDAIGWKPDWTTHGWPVSSSPSAGTIGWFGSKAGAYGHVNYIQKVNSDGSVHMEEYNWGAHPQAYGERDAAPGDAGYPDFFLGMPPVR